jgi:hypothetical protein
VNWLVLLTRLGIPGSILADDMGLVHTALTTFVSFSDGICRQMLVACIQVQGYSLLVALITANHSAVGGNLTAL